MKDLNLHLLIFVQFNDILKINGVNSEPLDYVYFRSPYEPEPERGYSPYRQIP